MKEETIKQVAAILEEWNPLGERANSIQDLEGYRYEAIDIIATYPIMAGSNKIAASTKQVLEGAFNLSLNNSEVEPVANKISKVLK